MGSHLVERLLDLGVKVVVVDDFSTGKEENLQKVLKHDKLEVIKADVNNFSEIEKVFRKQRIYYVFHYASIVGVKNLKEEPLKALEDIDGIKNILELSKKHRVKKLIFASSSEAVGEPLVSSEESINIPSGRNIHGLVKLIGEELVKIYHKKYDFPGCALRFYNVYGPRQDYSPGGFVVGIFINQILNGEKPTIFGDGLQTRDFLFVKDTVEAAIRALLTGKTAGQVIDVGRGRQITILGLAERVIELSGKDLKPEFLSDREGDIKYRCPDIKNTRRILRFVPEYPLDKGLEITYEWYKQNLS